MRQSYRWYPQVRGKATPGDRLVQKTCSWWKPWTLLWPKKMQYVYVLNNPAEVHETPDAEREEGFEQC